MENALNSYRKALLSNMMINCLVYALRFLSKVGKCLCGFCRHGLSLQRGDITDSDLYNFAGNILVSPIIFWPEHLRKESGIAIDNPSSLEVFREVILDLTDYEISMLRKGLNHRMYGYFS